MGATIEALGRAGEEGPVPSAGVRGTAKKTRSRLGKRHREQQTSVPASLVGTASLTIRSPASANPDVSAEAVALGVLLQACGQGNRLAFETLYRATSSRLFGICLRYLSNRAEAEEVLQEVYTAVWLKATTFDPQLSAAMTWLASIARHKAIDRRRAQHLHEPLDGLDEWPAPECVAEDFAAQRQRRQIDRCLETLGKDQQAYIRVAFFEGYSYAELAARHSIALGTMKSWIRRGLLQLRACLGL